jgi:HEAT repeat protein
MPNLVALALFVALAPQLPENQVRETVTAARPWSGVYDGRTGRLVVPRGAAGAEAAPQQAPGSAPQDPARPAGSDEAFLREVRELRRSLFVPESKQQAIVERVGGSFDRVPERCVALMRSEGPDMVHALMTVLRVHGRPEHAEELEFLLLTRPFRSATEVVLDTMAIIAREQAAERLFACLTASRPNVRHHAAELLGARLRPEHAERLILLSQQAELDVQIKALRLLGAVPPTPPVRARLRAALSEDPRLAEAAVEALVRHGAEPAADLQEILRRPALGRETGYAALALAAIEDAAPGTALVTDDMAEHLLAELDAPDPFQRGAVAIALAGLAWRSDDASGTRFGDRAIVAALLELVAPTEFVAHLATLSRLATPRLVQLTGLDFGAAHGPWRSWWSEVEGSGFVGARRHVSLDGSNVASASLRCRGPAGTVVLRGEKTRAPAGEGIADLVVSGAEMTALVADLERLGFMGEVRRGRGDADPRALALAVDGVVARSDPMTAPQVLDRMFARIDAVARANRWQAYRDPQREPDPVAFWRAESRWLEQHPDPREQADRLKERILAVLPKRRGADAARAADDLLAIADLRSMLTEADGLALAEVAREAPDWDPVTFRLLELALLAPGAGVWPRLVEVARARDEAAATADGALKRIFALAGPDRILEALDHPEPAVRRVAMDEIASLGDQRAVPKLLATALDPAEATEQRRTAVFALGRLRTAAAREPLLGLLDQEVLDPGLRRTTWVALARIGGEQVFAALQEAFPSPEEADRRAIIQALGAMRHPQAARELANILGLRGTDALGNLALDELRQQGDLLASPALIPLLQHRSVEIRREAAMLLGDFQHPAALGELFEMLREDEARARLAAAIAGITGQDVTGDNRRVEYLREWYATHGGRSQGEWLLQALTDYGVAHSLNRAQVQADAGVAAVPELTRLVLECEQPWLRSLAARILRVTTGEDHGALSALATEAQRSALCERYRLLYDASQAASGR